MDLKGKRALVTGSSRGIGLSIARMLVQEGVNVIVNSRHQRDIDQVVDLIGRSGGSQVLGKAGDIRVAEEVRELIGFCVTQLGGIEILINNAGIRVFKTVEETTPEEWHNVIGTNLDGVFYACHFAVPEMKKNREGFIINVSSLAATRAFPGGAAYNASKFALTGFSEALMQEVRYQNIRVAYIMPGSVDTSFSTTRSGRETSWKLSASDVAEVVVETLKRNPRCLSSRIEMRPSKPPEI